MTELYARCVRQVDDVVEKVEQNTGYIFEDFEIGNVLLYTIRKWEATKKDQDYIMILFENELIDYLLRKEVNAMRHRPVI